MLSPSSHKQRIEELAQRCSETGRPMTLQRLAVMESLLSRNDHPTADEVHSSVIVEKPNLSRATVYRSLETLVDLGCIAKVDHRGVAVRFDARTDRHHHLICDRCGAIEDLDLADSVAATMPSADSVRARSNFQMRDYSVTIHGTCAGCLPSSS